MPSNIFIHSYNIIIILLYYLNHTFSLKFEFYYHILLNNNLINLSMYPIILKSNPVIDLT